MKALVLAASILAAGMPASADSPARRVPVNVDLVGDDGLTQRLRDALVAGLHAHRHLRLADTPGEAVLTIRSESNVDSDRLDGRLVVIYTIVVARGEDAGEPEVGICYESRLSKCVNDILRLVEGDADHS